MKKIVVTVLALAASLLTAQSHFPYRPAATADGAFAVYANPSLLGAEKGFNLLMSVKHDYIKDAKTQNEWYDGEYMGVAFNYKGFGFYKTYTPKANKTITEFGVSLGAEMTSGVYGGTTFRWFDESSLKKEMDFFLTVRPYEYLSFSAGLTNIAKDRNVVNSLYSLAYRPFSEKLTLAAESRVNGDNFEKMDYNLSLNAEAWPGINLIASYGDNLDKSDAVLGLGLNMTLGKLQLGSYSASNDDFKNAQSSSYMQISSETGKMPFTNPASKIVKIKLAGNYAEELANYKMFGLNIAEKGNTARGLMDNIKALKNDPQVAGIVLDCDSYSMSFAAREELRETLVDFKSSGKKIYSYFTSSSQSNYFLISLSDKIAMHPQGGVEINGLGMEMVFFKKLMDQFGIEWQATRHGKYKSAVEQFTLEKASPANREQMEVLLKSLDVIFKEKICSSRGIALADLDKMIDTNPYFDSENGISSKIVDEIFYPDQLDDKVKSLINSKAEIVEADNYFKVQHKNYAWKGFSGDKIAVVYATGEIQSGESGSGGLFGGGGSMGDITVSKMIKEAAEDKDVKAIVIRVDSPGGSGLASDNILRQIRLAKEKNKTIIVSMGGLAASGGYYISCFADKIYTDATTVTGSIGVFGMMPTLDSLYNRLGITHEKITLNKFAGNASFPFSMHKMNKDEADLMQKQVDRFYDVFIGLVAEGRKMTKEQVDNLGQGRVWSGVDAVKNGLADEIGGLKEAIAEAKKRAAIDSNRSDAEVVTYYTKTGKFNPLSMLGGMAMSLLPAKVQETGKALESLSGLTDKKDNLLLMPVNLEIK